MTTSTEVDISFVKHFQAEVCNAYQQMGSKLKSTVRVKNNVRGASTTFQKIGKGTAGQKEARNGTVPLMSLIHEPIECSLADYYAGDWIDSLDEIKIAHDERKAIATAGAYALGRKTDELVINALNTLSDSEQIIGDGSAVLSKENILSAFEKLNENDIPDDGERYALVGPKQWNVLLSLPEFSSADYVGDNTPYLAGCESRKWMGINFIMHTGLPVEDGKRKCFIYHKTAVGLGVGMDIKTDITWHGDRAAHFVNNMMSQGACLIDPKGVVAITVADNA